MAGLHAAAGVCEYDVAGGIRGEPVDVVRGAVTDLPLPATAEIAVEGHIPPGRFEPEGPVRRVDRLLRGGPRETAGHRGGVADAPERPHHPRHPRRASRPATTPIFPAFSAARPSGNRWKPAGVPGIKGVWNHEGCGSQMFITVAIEQMYQGHAKQAAMAAAGSYAGSYLNKMIVVVDDDIDPTDADAVLWAMCTRVDPDSGSRHRPQLLEQPPGPHGLPRGSQELQQEDAHRRLPAVEPKRIRFPRSWRPAPN